MSFIRPEARAALWRLRELFAALGLGLIGAWIIALGGLVLMPLGAVMALLAAGFGLLAWRRLRFAQAGDAPGVVELDEGQISYFGPSFGPNLGGAVALRELVELRLMVMQGRRLWRLRQQDGQVLLIPVEAAGAEALFDAFASLPGMDSGVLVDAVTPRARTGTQGKELVTSSDSRVIWQHPARVVLT